MGGGKWTILVHNTKIGLGIVTLVALLLVFFAVGWDLLVRKVSRTPARIDLSNIDADLQELLRGSHTLSIPGLGLTMADGGERVEPSKSEDSNKKSKE